jgi:hypothetical protein
MFKVDLPPDSSWKWETENYENDGHNQPCYYCGELCNNFAGDPGQWSVRFPEKDDPGKMKSHHMGCLLKKLDVCKKYKQTLEDIADILFGYDGYNKAPNLKRLIDEVTEIINESLRE